MSAKLIDNVLVLSNPALMVIPGVEDSYSDFNQLPPLDRNYPLSLEMIDFLTRYDMGSYTDSESHRRCFKIGIRKGCYGNRLINDFGFLTETGREALINAKTLDRRIKHYYERARKTWLTPATAKDMDEIVPYGSLPGFALRMMTYLWEANLPEDADNSDQELKIKKTVPMPHNWTIARTAIEGDVYLLMSSIRNNMYARQAADVCLKFGLIDLVPLPKALHSQGRGRAPLGITLSPAGNRFYESYLEAFDPQRKFQQYVKTSYRQAHPEEFGDVPISSSPSVTTISSGYYSLRDQVQEVVYEPAVGGPAVSYNPTTEPDVQDQTDYPTEIQDQPQPAHQSQKGPVSDLPDIVDGENLKDLFG